jgi:hypothetical protein
VHTGLKLDTHHCSGSSATRRPSLHQWPSLRVARLHPQYSARIYLPVYERQLIIHISPESGSGGKKAHLHRHHSNVNLGFLQTKYRASSCADRYRLAVLSIPKRQPVTHTGSTGHHGPFGSSLNRHGATAHCYSLAPKSFADDFLTFSGSLDDAALLLVISLQRTTGDTTSILCLLVSLVPSHGPRLSDHTLLSRVPTRVIAFECEVLDAHWHPGPILGLGIVAETSGVFPPLESSRSARYDLSTD